MAASDVQPSAVRFLRAFLFHDGHGEKAYRSGIEKGKAGGGGGGKLAQYVNNTTNFLPSMVTILRRARNAPERVHAGWEKGRKYRVGKKEKVNRFPPQPPRDCVTFTTSVGKIFMSECR